MSKVDPLFLDFILKVSDGIIYEFYDVREIDNYLLMNLFRKIKEKPLHLKLDNYNDLSNLVKATIKHKININRLEIVYNYDIVQPKYRDI
jgi:hypothetical protein